MAARNSCSWQKAFHSELRRRFIEANAAPDAGEVRTPADDDLTHQEATELLANHCADQSTNFSCDAHESLELINQVWRSLHAAPWRSTGEGLLESGKLPRELVQRRLQCDDQALQWKHFRAFETKFFAAYAATYDRPGKVMLAVHTWRNIMLNRVHGILDMYDRFVTNRQEAT